MLSASAGPAIDQLASEYSNDSVIFLEYNVDNPPAPRIQRFWAAFGGGYATLPLTMVDSGHEIHTGYMSGIYEVYKGMVDAALTRPPGAVLRSTWERIGNHVHFSVQVTNQSGVTLGPSNSAAVHVIVYEENHIQYTGRFVRAAVATGISNLANNASANFTLDTPDLVGVDWDELNFLVLVDYRPNGVSGAYDMLQAAFATGISIKPDELTFLVDPSDLNIQALPIQISSTNGLSWTGTPGAAWIDVIPSSGLLPVQPQISVNKGLLSNGWQNSQVTFSNFGGLLEDPVIINAFLGDVSRVYLPIIQR
jgi:hypothetical protein